MEGVKTVLLAVGEEGLPLCQISQSRILRAIFHRVDVAQAAPPKTSFPPAQRAFLKHIESQAIKASMKPVSLWGSGQSWDNGFCPDPQWQSVAVLMFLGGLGGLA